MEQAIEILEDIRWHVSLVTWSFLGLFLYCTVDFFRSLKKQRDEEDLV